MQKGKAIQDGWTCTNWTKRQLFERGARKAGRSNNYVFYWHPKLGARTTLLAVREASGDFAVIWETGLFSVPEPQPA